MSRQTAFLFDLDGTLVDSVYQHVLAWHEALQREGIPLSMSVRQRDAPLVTAATSLFAIL